MSEKRESTKCGTLRISAFDLDIIICYKNHDNGYTQEQNRMIKTDCHLHTTFSTDGISEMEDMIKAAIEKGLEIICFTEHNDYGAGFEGEGNYVVDTGRYLERLRELSEKYRDSITVLFGVEIGFLEHVKAYFDEYVSSYPFDFVIGSSHTAGTLDPYFPEYYTHFKTTCDAYRYYFESELNRARIFDCYDSYGHLDYALRYGPGGNSEFTYEKYADLLDPLLEAVIERGKVIEVNSSGLRKGMNGPNPAVSIIKRYRELGGLPLTIGSDAHETKDIASGFDEIKNILLDCGYKTYSIFEKRVRREIPLR